MFKPEQKIIKRILQVILLFLGFVWASVNGYFAYKIQNKQDPRDALVLSSLFLCVLFLYLFFYKSRDRLLRIGSHLLLALVPIVSMVLCLAMRYFLITGTTLTRSDVYAIHQTYLPEAVGFINAYIDSHSIFYAILWLVITLTYMLALSRAFKTNVWLSGTGFVRVISPVILLGWFIFYASNNEIVKELVVGTRDYYSDLAVFRKYQSNLSNKEKPQATKKEKGDLLVVVIGESSSRDYMESYSGKGGNTPWATHMGRRYPEHWVQIRNAYAYFPHTMQSVTAMLSEDRIYTGFRFPRTVTLFDVAKSAGIKTAWISNQYNIGPHDNVVAALAYSADEVFFTGNKWKWQMLDDVRPQHFDEDILPLFQRQLNTLDSRENAIIFIHLYGNHTPYRWTFPTDFPRVELGGAHLLGRFDIRGRKPLFSTYLTSIAYSDFVLSQIHKKLITASFKSKVMVYIADHGEEVLSNAFVGHNLGSFTWSQARIPMYVWMSNEYKEKYAAKYKALVDNANGVFTNDLLFDCVVGLMNIKSDQYVSKYDISSSEYAINFDNAKIYTGDVKSDPMLIATINAERMPVLAAHKCNSIYKAMDALMLGITKIEIDVIYEETLENNGKLMVGHDANSMTKIELEKFLLWIQKDIEFIWLDVKNLNSTNANAILKYLEELDKTFALKHKLLVESYNVEGADLFAGNEWNSSYFIGYNLMSNNDNDRFMQIVESINKGKHRSVSFDLNDAHVFREKIAPYLIRNVDLYAFCSKSSLNFSDPTLEIAIQKYSDLDITHMIIELDSYFDI